MGKTSKSKSLKSQSENRLIELLSRFLIVNFINRSVVLNSGVLCSEFFGLLIGVSSLFLVGSFHGFQGPKKSQENAKFSFSKTPKNPLIEPAPSLQPNLANLSSNLLHN
jgi:hypothetical protein